MTGSSPAGGVVFDDEGNLYGTTQYGGNVSMGTIFKIDTAGIATTFYSFGGNEYPTSKLTFNGAGSLYGITNRDNGTLFKITKTGVFSTVFTSLNPYGQPVQDISGNMYGGGSTLGNPTYIYKIDMTGSKTVIHTFDVHQLGFNPIPRGDLAIDNLGNLYGGNDFSVTKLNITTGKHTLMHQFTHPQNYSDNKKPASVALDQAGNLYGATRDGSTSPLGTLYDSTLQFGTIYKIGTDGVYSVLHSFTGGIDGQKPTAGLVIDSMGNIYGGTCGGGSTGYGTIFKIDPSGVKTVIHTFAADKSDGICPTGSLALDSAGYLYGAAISGGPINPLPPNYNDNNGYGHGTVFRLPVR